MDEVRELLAEYGRWADDDTMPAVERAERLAGFVAGLLRRTLSPGAVQVLVVGGVPSVSFDHEGRDYLVSCTAGGDAARGGTLSRIVRDAGLTGRPGEMRWALLSWTRTPEPVGQLVEGVSAFGVVLDRSHLDAAVTGLLPLADLVRDVFRRRETYLPLAELACGPTLEGPSAGMCAAARLSVPVDVPARTWEGASSEVLLVGEAQEATPGGMAWRGPSSLLLTCEDGVLDLDPVSGRSQWVLALPGCHGAPLVGADGAVLVMCGPVVVRWHDGVLTAVAGGFEDGGQLLAGPDGEPWVLSGSGATFGAGDGTLALTRAGERAGEQLRYPVVFEAAVRSAVWLDGRRFFLAAGGHSAVVDLGRTTGTGPRESWIPSPGHYPAHLLTAGPDSVLSASPDGSGNRITLHRTAVGERVSEPVAEFRLDRILGLAQEPGTGPAYLLASVPDNDPARVRPVLVRVEGHRPAVADGGGTLTAGPPATEYDVVSRSARGVRKDYRLDRLPMASEGQGDVFNGVHKASGTVVAYKRRRRLDSRARRRMVREVTVAQVLGGHPHVMPVLDFSPDYDWFVMPRAQATVADRRAELREGSALRALVDAVSAALAEAHSRGWVHRDVKPQNILLLNGRWTVADWGIARRPRGQTSVDGVLTNTSIGSLGWAAPELSADPHDGAVPASDIYGLGQVIGWILTGTWPQPNVPLLPPPGPWRGVVRQATYPDPAARPQDMAAFLDLVERETSPRTGLPITRARALLEATAEGDENAAAQLIALAVDHPGDYELSLDAVARMDVEAAVPALLANPHQSIALVRAMAAQADGDRGQWPTPDEADIAVRWLLGVARAAAQASEWDLLDAAAQGMCVWDGRFDQWGPQDAIRHWLRILSGHAAEVVASVLREHPHSALHFHELENERHVDTGLRGAVRAAVAPVRP
ncbi:protein kinase domain-containing protein [Streptomyces yaizuensis]|uniref:non-specific serine/threonine protein kinase n=1 Tax=Streptomyces yaizuensis TaxID=2989713 RepID=A0ABQ5P6R7_9ACTN|nr:protein kinase [Streptomyces sp. YSPA8]GLF98257.1 protein kinase [Streptomyces sp. YSPA8]